MMDKPALAVIITALFLAGMIPLIGILLMWLAG